VILHGGGEGRLRLSIRSDSLYCQVADYGPGIARSHTAGWRPPGFNRADAINIRIPVEGAGRALFSQVSA